MKVQVTFQALVFFSIFFLLNCKHLTHITYNNSTCCDSYEITRFDSLIGVKTLRDSICSGFGEGKEDNKLLNNKNFAIQMAQIEIAQILLAEVSGNAEYHEFIIGDNYKEYYKHNATMLYGEGNFKQSYLAHKCYYNEKEHVQYYLLVDRDKFICSIQSRTFRQVASDEVNTQEIDEEKIIKAGARLDQDLSHQRGQKLKLFFTDLPIDRLPDANKLSKETISDKNKDSLVNAYINKLVNEKILNIALGKAKDTSLQKAIEKAIEKALKSINRQQIGPFVVRYLAGSKDNLDTSFTNLTRNNPTGPIVEDELLMPFLYVSENKGTFSVNVLVEGKDSIKDAILKKTIICDAFNNNNIKLNIKVKAPQYKNGVFFFNKKSLLDITLYNPNTSKIKYLPILYDSKSNQLIHLQQENYKWSEILPFERKSFDYLTLESIANPAQNREFNLFFLVCKADLNFEIKSIDDISKFKTACKQTKDYNIDFVKIVVQ